MIMEVSAYEQVRWRQVVIPIEGPLDDDKPIKGDFGPFMGTTMEIHIKGRKYHLLGKLRKGRAPIMDMKTGDVYEMVIRFDQAPGGV